MRLPSRNHFGCATPVGTLVSRVASPPASGSTYSCGAVSPLRWLTNASDVPSGLISGDDSFAGCVVSARSTLPSVDQSQRSVRPLSSLRSKRVTGAMTVAPSGEIVGAPMRWICQERSALKGTGSSAIAAAVTVRASVAARSRICKVGNLASGQVNAARYRKVAPRSRPADEVPPRRAYVRERRP